MAVTRAAPGALARHYATALEGCGLLAGFTILAIAVMVCVDVLIRNLGLGNLPWLIEVAEYAIYGATFIAAPWALHLGAHVRVDVLVQGLPAGPARAVNVLVDGIGAAISAVLLWYSLAITVDAYRLESLIFKELVVPEWWLLALMPLPCALLALEFALRIARTVRGEPQAGASVGGL